jgi:hypothetical protein
MKITFAACAAVLAIAVSGCATDGQSGAASLPRGAVMSENFENVAVGEIPAGFTKTGNIAVQEGVAHSGKRALRIEPQVRGGRFISLDPEKVATLGGEHWGRMYFKLKTPAPLPTGKLIHITLVDGKGTSPSAKDLIDVRLATLLYYPNGDYGWFYNVQPPNGRKEFGPKSAIMQKFTDDWQLLEWHADAANQSYAFYVNGKEVKDIGQKKGAGNFENVELPEKFQTLSFGFTNYQPATDEGFTVYVDDIAVGKNRLGPVKGAKK